MITLDRFWTVLTADFIFRMKNESKIMYGSGSFGSWLILKLFIQSEYTDNKTSFRIACAWGRVSKPVPPTSITSKN